MAKPVIDEVRWKSSFPNAGVKADVAFKATEKIRKQNGGLTAEAVVNEAAKESSVLHPLFEWDDSEAAKQFRLEQARSLIRAFHVTYKESPGKAPMRAYEIVEKAPRTSSGEDRSVSVYGTTADMIADPEQRSRLINEAIAQLVVWRRKFSALNELAKICDAIDETVAALK